MKPKHIGGYNTDHAALCEQVLVTLLRGLGERRSAVYLVGGLVPRYLLGGQGDSPHAGTTDVDLVLSLPILADIEAYNRLEQILKRMGFERGRNEEGIVNHFSWWKRLDARRTIVVDLLCDTDDAGGHAVSLPGEKRVSALQIRGARLVEQDHVTVSITAEMFDERGVATVEVRVAGFVAFIVLKCLAYENRVEEKDAYDIIYCLHNHPEGPEGVARAFAAWRTHPDDSYVRQAVDILRARFATDSNTDGHRKDGPRSYARFLTDPGRPDDDLRYRRQAARSVEAFLAVLDAGVGE